MDSNLPKYSLLKDELIKNIDDEIYKPDEAIPSERSLTELYDVSRITVRKAIDELVCLGYLYKLPGKGTFVRGDKYSCNLISISSSTDSVKSLGYTPTCKVISQYLIRPTTLKKHLLELDEDDIVFNLRRVVLANGIPLNYTNTFINYKFFRGIEHIDFNTNSLYHIMEEKYGVKFTTATRTVEATLADEELSNYLNIKVGSPVLLFNTTTRALVNGADVPIETYRCYYRTDKFKFFVNQVNTDFSNL